MRRWEGPPLSAHACICRISLPDNFNENYIRYNDQILKFNVSLISGVQKKSLFPVSFVLLTGIWSSQFLLEMFKNWIGKNTVYFFIVALSYLSWVTEYSVVPEGNADLLPVSHTYLQDMMETVLKENFSSWYFTQWPLE